MPHTDHLELLLSELRTNETLRAAFVANPSNAITPFELTSHERHAILVRDCEDFVALGTVSSTDDLPDVMGCPGGGGGGGGVDISDLLDAIRGRLEGLLEWVPRPGIPGRGPVPPKPDPEPEPRPTPGPRPPRPGPRPPRPGPTPGPDPPGPDDPGGRSPGPDPRGGGRPRPPRD